MSCDPKSSLKWEEIIPKSALLEDQETNAETGNGYHIKTTTAYGKGLEETVESARAGR